MLENLKWKFARFMGDRYGVDHLYIASGILFIALQFVNLFLKNPILNIVLTVFIIWVFYRVFSKDIGARQAENQKFLAIMNGVKSKGNIYSRRLKDIKTHRYRKCPECNTTLRLPRKRGKHKVRCPKCAHRFDVKIRL